MQRAGGGRMDSAGCMPGEAAAVLSSSSAAESWTVGRTEEECVPAD